MIEVFHSSPNQINKTKDVRELQGDLSPRTPPNMRGQIPTKHINLDSANVVVMKGPESHNETCIKDPQSCSGMVF